VIKATFSERVRGVSAKSVKLYKKKGARKVLIRTRVTLLKGKVAKVDPTRRLSAGDYILIFVASKITDVAGNTLAPSSAAKPLRTGSTQLARTMGGLG
jgi:5-hydroxyisourate hydrolase-like protein (transthyretin family)